MTARQGTTTNAHLKGTELDELMGITEGGSTLLEQAMTQLGLSARAYDKVRRVARTIADVEGTEEVRPDHVGEAVQYRLFDRRL